MMVRVLFGSLFLHWVEVFVVGGFCLVVFV